MEVLDLPLSNYLVDPVRVLDFARFSDQAGDFILGSGLYDWEYVKELKKTKNKKIVQLDFEDPSKFFVKPKVRKAFFYQDEYFDKIFSICPYTVEWLNNEEHNNKRTLFFYPFNEELIPVPKIKEFDIIYTGHIVNPVVLSDIKQITKYNYRLVSGTKSDLVTDYNVSHLEKFDLTARSKISLCHNSAYPRRSQLLNLFRIKHYRRNKAFKFTTITNFILSFFTGQKYFLLPQMKGRTFEAAFCRSLILCKKDPFNVIERFFEPNKEFVYFEEGKLQETVDKILANYDDYLPIIENAYRRAIKEYSTKAFFEKYLKNFS